MEGRILIAYKPQLQRSPLLLKGQEPKRRGPKQGETHKKQTPPKKKHVQNLPPLQTHMEMGIASLKEIDAWKNKNQNTDPTHPPTPQSTHRPSKRAIDRLPLLARPGLHQRLPCLERSAGPSKERGVGINGGKDLASHLLSVQLDPS